MAWTRKLEEIESNFLSCEQAGPPPAPAHPKKRGRKRKAVKDLVNKGENPEMAILAASLQIAHFHKVHACT